VRLHGVFLQEMKVCRTKRLCTLPLFYQWGIGQAILAGHVVQPDIDAVGFAERGRPWNSERINISTGFWSAGKNFISVQSRSLKGSIGSFARKKAQTADICCLLSLNNTCAQRLPAKFLIGPEE